MEYKRLGWTNLEVSRIAFGCWAIGGHGYGVVDDSESITAINEALRLGINFFDTADVYGFGHSESILSKALGGRRHTAIIATKFGVRWDETGKTCKDISPHWAVKALEDSLRRLRIDCIPLYQIHWPDGHTPLEDTLEALVHCQHQGKIQYIGCSNFSASQLSQATGKTSLASLQSQFSLLERREERVLQEASCAKDMGVLAYGVLARGLLSAKYDSEHSFNDCDTRSRDPNFQIDNYNRNKKIVECLKKLANYYNKTPAQVAIRWVLDTPFVTSAIVGIKTQLQAQSNISSLHWRLTEEHFAYLSNFFEK